MGLATRIGTIYLLSYLELFAHQQSATYQARPRANTSAAKLTQTHILAPLARPGTLRATSSLEPNLLDT